MKRSSLITPTKIVEANSWNNKINYTTEPIIQPNRKVIRITTSEELHSQKEVGWMNEQRKINQTTLCPHTIV